MSGSVRGPAVVTVTANSALDLTYRLPPGAPSLADSQVEVHRAEAATVEASGKGVNVSRALTLAGRPSPAVLFAGGANGRHLLELLDAEQVPYRAVATAAQTRINVNVLTPGRGSTKVNAPGVTPTTADFDNLVDAVSDALATVRTENGPDRDGVWLLICGSFPPGTDVEGLVGRLIAAARAAGARVGVDSSGTALRAAARAGVELLAPNRSELAAAFGGTEPERIATQRGCALLVSLGADGALWTDGRRSLRAQAETVEPVNPAGAGDALLAGWFGTESTDPAIRLATAVAWGTAACLVPTTVRTGDPAPDPGAVRVSERPQRGSPP